MDPVVLLHILYGNTFPPFLLSPLTLHPCLLYSLVCLCCVSAADGWQRCLRTPAFAPSHGFSPAPSPLCLKLGVLRYSWGLQPAQLSGGCRKPPRDKAAVQPFWGQELLLCWVPYQCWLALDWGTAVHMPQRYLAALSACVL